MTRRLCLLLVGVVLAAGCGGGDADAPGELTPVSDVATVAEAFDRDKGHARLVLLLSPT